MREHELPCIIYQLCITVLSIHEYSPALEVSHVKRVKCEAVRILGHGDQCVGDLGIGYPLIPCRLLTDSKHR